MVLFPQCQVAAAMVAASTSLGYQTVKQLDTRSNSGKSTVMWRQPSSCSTCSGGSNCGTTNRNSGSSPNNSFICSRCQSFHRHNHRQRRRSSQLNTPPIMNKLKSASTSDVLDDEQNTELTEICGKKSILIKKEQTTLMGIGVGLMATGMTGSGFHTVSARSTTSVNTTPSTSTSRKCTFAPTTVTIHSPMQTRENRTQKPQSKSSLKQTTPSIMLQRPASSYTIGDNLSIPKDNQSASTSNSHGGSLSSMHIIE